MELSDVEAGETYVFTDEAHPTWLGMEVRVDRINGVILHVMVTKPSPDRTMSHYPVGSTAQFWAKYLSPLIAHPAAALFT